MKNYGVILEKPKGRDYLFGAVKNNITCDDWGIYLPKFEKQHSVYFDSMACVSFSAINCVEAIFKYQINHKMISADNMIWLKENGYINDDEVNFSDRFIAKLSKTSRQGNTGKRVAQAIRDYGLIPEAKWNYPVKQRVPVFNWDNYYKEVPEELLDLGKEFKKRFEFNYESIKKSEYEEALVNSPIQVYGHAWEKPINGVYQYTNKKINHAIMAYKPRWDILDHYLPFIKRLAPSFKFWDSGYKYTIKEKYMAISQAKIISVKNSKEVGLYVPAIDEKSFQNICMNHGINIATINGEVNWEKVKIDGELVFFNNPVTSQNVIRKSFWSIINNLIRKIFNK